MLKRIQSAMKAFGLGLLVMYFVDPQFGSRRRSMLRDRRIGLQHEVVDLFDKGFRDIGHRIAGTAFELKAMATRASIPDEVLIERVHAALGGVIPTASAIEVSVRDGAVTLGGTILKQDVDRVLVRVLLVQGVSSVDNQLHVQDDPVQAPSRQVDREEWEAERRRMAAIWAPGPRMLAIVSGALLFVFGYAGRRPFRLVRRVLGLGLLTRGVANRPLRQLVGLDMRSGVIDVHKSITIDAPLDDVFSVWCNYSNFPEFMANVREIQNRGDGSSHWVVQGPIGTTVSWDARITRSVPNQVISWTTEPGSTVMQSGTVRFTELPEGGTRIDLHLSYTPPAGLLGHAVATMFGTNPKREIDEDLARLKSLFEHGKTTAHGKTVTRAHVLMMGDGGCAMPIGSQGSLERSYGQGNGHSYRGHAQSAGSQAADRGTESEQGMQQSDENRIDVVGDTGVSPASGPLPPGDAQVQGMASWGQGERGAEGYEDSGTSEIWLTDEERKQLRDDEEQKDREKQKEDGS